jgi:hypothetical protein
MSKRNRENLLSVLQDLKIELILSYRDMEMKAALVNFTLSWYEFASYTIEETNGNFSKVYLHLDDFVTI